jgi:glutamine amidotransferase
MMRGTGTVNADGFGIGWYPDGMPAAARYRRSVPIWADPSLPSLASAITSTAVVAAVRSGTEGMPVTEGACAPFNEHRWLFSHNGAIDDWADTLASLAGELPVRDLVTLDAPTDSALLWALVRSRLRAGIAAAEAMTELTAAVARLTPGRLNLLLCDGTTVVATAWGDSLFYHHDAAGLLVASEPSDDGEGWIEVPDRSLLSGNASRVTVTPLVPGTASSAGSSPDRAGHLSSVQSP